MSNIENTPIHDNSVDTTPSLKTGLMGMNFDVQPNYSRPTDQKLIIMAHQGWQEVSKPNSFNGITATFGKADAVEFDLYSIPVRPGSEENVLVCCHPEGYFLFVNPAGMKNTDNLPLSYEEIKELTVDGAPLIPRLDQVLDEYHVRCNQSGKWTELQLEQKGPNTTEPLVELIQAKIAEGKLTYDNVLVTGLCYPGDRSRLERPHELDKNLRSVLAVRGGDFSADGFPGGWDEVIDFAKQNNIVCITGQRRGTSVADLERIQAAGIAAGVFHARTSDELDRTLAMGADYVAADCFNGVSYEDYPGVRLEGTPVFTEVDSTGFFKMSEYLWEMGWACESLRKNSEEIQALQTADQQIIDFEQGDAAVQHSFEDTTLKIQLFTDNALSDTVLNYTDVSIDAAYVGDFDTKESPRTYGELLSKESLEYDCNRLIAAVLSARNIDFATDQFFSFDNIVKFSEGDFHSQSTVVPELFDPVTAALLEETSRQFLTRAGRIVGMLGFTALMPRHMEREFFTIVIDSPITENSTWARLGADEQIQAQLLRSGKRGIVTNLDQHSQ